MNVRSYEPMSRFTAWLSMEERQGVDQMADEFGSSANYVVRLAVRAALGLSMPKGIQFPPEPVLEREEHAEGQASP